MSRFAAFMENRSLQPLYEEAARLISADIPYAIRYCESRAVNRNPSLGEIYRRLASELHSITEVDWAASVAATKAAMLKKKDAELKAQTDTAAKATEAEAERKKKEADAEELRKAALAKAAGGRHYSAAPDDMVNMLRSIGYNLSSIHKAGGISQDYAGVIQSMVMDLTNYIRTHSSDPASRKAAAASRHAAASTEFEKKASVSKSVSDMMEVIKTLRDHGLPDDVGDNEAGAAYEHLLSALSAFKGGEPGMASRALKFWISQEMIGDKDASPAEVEVMKALVAYGEAGNKHAPMPGSHKHTPKSEPESDEASEDEEWFNDIASKGDLAGVTLDQFLDIVEELRSHLHGESQDDQKKMLGEMIKDKKFLERDATDQEMSVMKAFLKHSNWTPEPDDEDLAKGTKDDLFTDDDDDFEELGHSVPTKKMGGRMKPVAKMFDLNHVTGMKVDHTDPPGALVKAVSQAFVAGEDRIEPVKNELGAVLRYLGKFLHRKDNVKTKVTHFFQGKKRIGGEPVNDKASDYANKIVSAVGADLDELKGVIVHVMDAINKFDPNTPENAGYNPDWAVNAGNTLQEQQQYSNMLKVLAGIKK
jgi:transcriptional regulator of met regulon